MKNQSTQRTKTEMKRQIKRQTEIQTLKKRQRKMISLCLTNFKQLKMLREHIHSEIRHRVSLKNRSLKDRDLKVRDLKVRDLEVRGTADKDRSKLREEAEKVKTLELHQHHHKAGEQIILSQFSQQSALIS